MNSINWPTNPVFDGMDVDRMVWFAHNHRNKAM